MSLKRALILGVAALAACDPTGNTNISTSAASIRLVNLVTDASAIDLVAGGVAVHSNAQFGLPTIYKLISTSNNIVAVRRTSDFFVLGSDTLAILESKAYTYYTLGQTTTFRRKLVLDDTLLTDSGSVKLRFIHGNEVNSISGLDIYMSLSTDTLANISPTITGLGYALNTSYLTVDTTLKRLRITLTGQTTTLFDTTFATATPRQVRTIVITDKQGGGTPARLQVVVDKAP